METNNFRRVGDARETKDGSPVALRIGSSLAVLFDRETFYREAGLMTAPPRTQNQNKS